MTLSVSLQHRFPDMALDVAFTSSGRLTALFGPSGCGKTSVVNAIAGLLHPDQARVALDGHDFADTASGTWVPPHRRRIGYVFQDARLLPHLTVKQNLRYGLWFTPAADRYADESAVVSLLGLAPLLTRKPAHLSGGERQRVAIGRALLQSPRLLLMDEPLASLDEARKLEILPYIERLRDEIKVPIVYVSHGVNEVARLATDVVLMAKGRVVQAGPVAEVLPLLAEAGGELAQDAGVLLEASFKAYDAANDLTTLASPAGDIRIAGRMAASDGSYRVHIRAADVMLATARPQDVSALNIFEGVVTAVTDLPGAALEVRINAGGSVLSSRITRFSGNRLGIVPGKAVYAVVKTMSVRPPGK
ncbi:molybdenum ABC transporter ATP-binding protein [Aestuariivirga sp.]|uniref:molybdenum ABC transporter ATP-binding protein n=1 Tax=Aestuariivirga sp. TaxID=2650926 RepID=UPI0039E28F9A